MKQLYLAGVLALCATSVQADIKYTQVTTSGDGTTAGVPASRTLRAVRNGAERSEMQMKLGNFEMNRISIRFCEPDRTVRLDPGLKIYTEEFANQNATTGQTTTGAKTSTPAGATKTGKIVMTYSVQDLGEETVADWKTRHYKIGMKMEASGCAGNQTTDMGFEYWVADVKDAVPCKNVDVTGMASGYQTTDCNITYETKGDVAAFTKASSGLIVKSKMFMDGKLMSTTEITSLSQAKLGDELFTIPADYKKVTTAEFDKAQQQAMMKAMMGGGNDDNE